MTHVTLTLKHVRAVHVAKSLVKIAKSFEKEKKGHATDIFNRIVTSKQASKKRYAGWKKSVKKEARQR